MLHGRWKGGGVHRSHATLLSSESLVDEVRTFGTKPGELVLPVPARPGLRLALMAPGYAIGWQTVEPKPRETTEVEARLQRKPEERK